MRNRRIAEKMERRKTDERVGDKFIGDSCRHPLLKRYRSRHDRASQQASRLPRLCIGTSRHHSQPQTFSVKIRCLIDDEVAGREFQRVKYSYSDDSADK